jgi:hypothetical protein
MPETAPLRWTLGISSDLSSMLMSTSNPVLFSPANFQHLAPVTNTIDHLSLERNWRFAIITPSLNVRQLHQKHIWSYLWRYPFNFVLELEKMGNRCRSSIIRLENKATSQINFDSRLKYVNLLDHFRQTIRAIGVGYNSVALSTTVNLPRGRIMTRSCSESVA